MRSNRLFENLLSPLWVRALQTFDSLYSQTWRYWQVAGSLLGVSIGRSLCYILVLVAVSNLILEARYILVCSSSSRLIFAQGQKGHWSDFAHRRSIVLAGER